MSALYFEMFVGKDDEDGLKAVREFFGLVDSQNWDALLSKYGDHIKALVVHGTGDETTKDALHKTLEHYLTWFLKEHASEQHVMFKFDTFTSFKQHEFMLFMNSLGIKHLEVSINNSSVSMTDYWLNENRFEKYEEGQWKWLPAPIRWDD